jgi:hypothetical protein
MRYWRRRDLGIKNKKMRSVIVGAVVIALVTIVAPSVVRARLGEDGDRIEYEYGQLVRRHLFDDETLSATYHKNNDRYVYVVLFDHGLSVSEKITRVDGREFSEKEIANFLKADAARAKWTKTPENGDKQERRFERSDHQAEAAYGKVDGRPTLTVRARKS